MCQSDKLKFSVYYNLKVQFRVKIDLLLISKLVNEISNFNVWLLLKSVLTSPLNKLYSLKIKTDIGYVIETAVLSLDQIIFVVYPQRSTTAVAHKNSKCDSLATFLKGSKKN